VNKIIYVRVTALGGGIVWTGNSLLSPNVWDINTSTNWLTGATPTTYLETFPPGDFVTFNDLGSGSVTLNTNVSPASVTVSNSAVEYTIAGTGQINSANLTKLGTGAINVNVPANYTGSTVISNGTYRLGANQTFNNLAGSGTLDSSAGAPLLTVSNSTATTFAGKINGALSLTKSGNSPFTLTGSNGFTGNFFVRSGTVVLDTNGSANNSTTWCSIGQLAGDNGVFTMRGNASFATTFDFNVGDVDSAIGTLNLQDTASLTGGGIFIASANSAGATAVGTVNQTGGSVTQTNTAVGNFVIGGRNAASTLGVGIYNLSGGTVTASGAVRLGAYGSGTVNQSGGTFTAKQGVNLQRFPGAVGTYNLNGGTLTTFNVASSTGDNANFNFNGGILQALPAPGNPFLSGLSQAIVLAGGAIIDSVTNSIVIPQPLLDGGTGGGLTKLGTGTLYLDGANSYTGITTVSNGVLAGVGSLAGSVLVKPAGSIGAGDAGSLGGLTINNNLTIQGKGFLRINQNGGIPTSDLITSFGTVNYGGTLVVSNTTSDATPLVAGNTFTLFSAGTHNGTFSNIVDANGTGVTYSFANGVLTVVSVTASNPTNITFSVSGNTLSLSWPADHLGWTLQQQTNSLATGLGTNWVNVPGSTSITSTNITINPALPTVFYRLKL
jgi:autotransporter-associated beta strand protein